MRMVGLRNGGGIVAPCSPQAHGRRSVGVVIPESFRLTSGARANHHPCRVWPPEGGLAPRTNTKEATAMIRNLLQRLRRARRPAMRPCYRPWLERLEDRLAPATLPSGFTEALVASGLQ